MKHCILVKFIPTFNLNNEFDNIKSIFDAINIKGVHDVEYKVNCIDRDNRYHLMIVIDMDKETLSSYDNCDAHKIWKDTYSKFIERKAIFDYE